MFLLGPALKSTVCSESLLGIISLVCQPYLSILISISAVSQQYGHLTSILAASQWYLSSTSAVSQQVSWAGGVIPPQAQNEETHHGLVNVPEELKDEAPGRIVQCRHVAEIQCLFSTSRVLGRISGVRAVWRA